MTKTFPDKHIRKALFDLLDGIIVDSNTINVFDTRVTGPTEPDHYILLTTQTNEVQKANKCEYYWLSTILIDVVTRYPRPGNPGSRVLVDNIMDAIREELETDLTLGGSLTVVWQSQSYPNDIVTATDTENVFRKFLRLELKIE